MGFRVQEIPHSSRQLVVSNRSIGDVVSTVGRVVVLCADRRSRKTSVDLLDGSWQPEPTDPAITCQVVTIGLCETSDGSGVVSPSGRYKRLRSDTKPDLCSTLTMSSTGYDSRTVAILENRWSRARKVGRHGNICPH